MKKTIKYIAIACYTLLLPVFGFTADLEQREQNKTVDSEASDADRDISGEDLNNPVKRERKSKELEETDQPKEVVIKEKEVDDNSGTGQASSVERIVMPFTQWVEKRIQNTSIVKPSVFPNKNKRQQHKGISLRQAIELARREYKGTVLGAERIEEKDNLTYRIKIISKDGVIKVIEVNGFAQNKIGEQ
ncbi:PepSY domain-containing protein [Agarilytica rhodophyticola]|uniref:PepSY domain-containing protein n=1 Tax=Agarilytica rhodophyticola TaxID=1737490 RepID=UPI000CD99861|nr:PepSY domain-containing protein [Agarilytica rhodophyticola]